MSKRQGIEGSRCVGERNNYGTRLAKYCLKSFSGDVDLTLTVLKRWNVRNRPPNSRVAHRNHDMPELQSYHLLGKEGD